MRISRTPLVVLTLMAAILLVPNGPAAPAAAFQAGTVDPLGAQAELLRVALQRYERLAADSSMPALDRLGAVLRPGDRHPGLLALRTRLERLGDLPRPADIVGDAELYDDILVAGIQRFQHRHGLEVDGVIGPATEGALREPLRTRVEQIAGAIAHLDARPPLEAERMVVVNIPMFQLWAWDAGEDGLRLAFTSRVIVGRPATPTPVFDAPIQDVVFRPEWNVPHSIVRNEIVPRLSREPDYLRRAGLQLVPPGGAGRSPTEVSAETLAALRAGSVRLRQPPGPGNALGLVKFVLPNPHDVYLHDTPQRALFDTARRAYSHGCVRVEAVTPLAVWLLDDESEWPAERVRSAMEGTASRTVAVRRPVPVRLVYLGAMVWPNGAVHFAQDVYRRADRFSATGCPS